MISVPEAKKLVEENCMVLPAEDLLLAQARGRMLAAPVVSNLDVPPFHQSAMDGYAFQFEDGATNDMLKVVGAIPAGIQPARRVNPGEAMRIFTGAPLPEGTDTVVMQERVTVEASRIRMDDPQLTRGSNVRLRGSQTQKGDIALHAGAKLTPGAIGFLAGLGVQTVKVWGAPRIGLIITGKELAAPGAPLQPGQVYESNSFALTAALQEMNIEPEFVFRSDDDEELITQYLNTCLMTCDLIIVTGGISVGDHDLVKKSMDNCQVETVFYKVKQKPGKPLFFGRKDRTLLFGLPGNPAAVLTCFYEYIVPSIRKMTGEIKSFSGGLKKVLTHDFVKKEGLTYFLKGKIEGDEVTPLNAQESYMMSSFAEADCLIVLEENKKEYLKGDTVEVHPSSIVS